MNTLTILKYNCYSNAREHFYDLVHLAVNSVPNQFGDKMLRMVPLGKSGS